jgi:hypothetical protein
MVKAPISGLGIAFSGVHSQFTPQPSIKQAPDPLSRIIIRPAIIAIRNPAMSYAWLVSFSKIFDGAHLIALAAHDQGENMKIYSCRNNQAREMV